MWGMLYCHCQFITITGMPDGKEAGVMCINLKDDYRCAIYDDPEYPKVCSGFKAEPAFCGQTGKRR